MGTETTGDGFIKSIINKHIVKLNNPLMGTETLTCIAMFHMNRSFSLLTLMYVVMAFLLPVSLQIAQYGLFI